MKKRNRMLALFLAFAMVLTFMPMMSFAEGEAADEDQQPVAAEAVEEAAEAVEEAAAEEPADDRLRRNLSRNRL